ncbi:hypothetical protein JW752_00870 [Candidatus Peregrinibacteria bacterium]|nr:hypothetical protein [Candidatus Peregrinibacteria bacterium]
MEINESAISELNQKRSTLEAEGFEFEHDQPNTAEGRALIMSEEAVLRSLDYHTRILRGITILDLWKRDAGKK